MQKLSALIAASIALTSVSPIAIAQNVKHRKLKTVAAGVAAYELAKHSHNRFAHKHRVAAGIAAAVAANHYMKKKHHPGH
jgi:hypothetical protein